MVKVIYTDEFVKAYNKLSLTVQKKAEKQEKIFIKNQFHPSLNTEKLQPKNREVWSFRIDRKYRILFRFLSKNQVLFLTIGPHDWIYKIRF